MQQGSLSPFNYARPGKSIAKLERYTYFHLSITYRTCQITQAILLIRWVDGGQDWDFKSFDCKARPRPL